MTLLAGGGGGGVTTARRCWKREAEDAVRGKRGGRGLEGHIVTVEESLMNTKNIDPKKLVLHACSRYRMSACFEGISAKDVT